MKWKRIDESSDYNGPVKIKNLREISPDEDSSLGTIVATEIEEFIEYRKRHWYTSKDKENEIRDATVGVYVEFEYWCEEDEEYEAGYEDGAALVIINKEDGSLYSVKAFGEYPDVFDGDEIEDAAYEYLDVEPGYEFTFRDYDN